MQPPISKKLEFPHGNPLNSIARPKTQAVFPRDSLSLFDQFVDLVDQNRFGALCPAARLVVIDHREINLVSAFRPHPFGSNVT